MLPLLLGKLVVPGQVDADRRAARPFKPAAATEQESAVINEAPVGVMP
jgi:hypothetical protein